MKQASQGFCTNFNSFPLIFQILKLQQLKKLKTPFLLDPLSPTDSDTIRTMSKIKFNSCNKLSMNDKNRLLHYRYNTIVKDQELNQSTKTRWSCNLKDKRINNNSQITKYRSIRELKKEIEFERNYTQRKPDQEKAYLNRFDKEQLQAKSRNYELVDIVKIKLYKNGTDKKKVKTGCTINRRELHQLLKKKKPADFTSSRSLESFKRIYPKKIDIFMNQLKMKVSTIEEQNKTIEQSNEEKKGEKTVALLRKQRIAVREWVKRVKAKPSIKIQTPKIETKPLRLMTQYDGEEVSGWQVQTTEENYTHNNPVLLKSNKFKQ